MSLYYYSLKQQISQKITLFSFLLLILRNHTNALPINTLFAQEQLIPKPFSPCNMTPWTDCIYLLVCCTPRKQQGLLYHFISSPIIQVSPALLSTEGQELNSAITLACGQPQLKLYLLGWDLSVGLAAESCDQIWLPRLRKPDPPLFSVLWFKSAVLLISLLNFSSRFSNRV